MATKSVKPFAVKGFNMTSPKGKALWCKVTEPDRMYNDKGVLSTSLVCNPDDPTVQVFITKLEELRDIALAETKETLGAKGAMYKPRPVFTQEYTKDGQESGNVIFKFTLKDVDDRKAEGKQGGIVVVDTKKQVVSPVPLIGNGSVVRCVAFANPYTMPNTKEVGVTLIWTKMQVIELVSFGGASDDFDEEEGFDSTEVAPSKTEEEFSDVDF
jgi:hypothetical protein